MVEKKLIVGLGNPGKGYESTRHNIGFRIIDLLCEKLHLKMTKKFNSFFGQADFDGKKLILLKPQQFMNRSGQAVSLVAGFYKLGIDDLLVISDDMALEPGRLRIRAKGSSGGHNGLANIIESLGSNEFARLRIGIGQSDIIDAVDYVLGKFSRQEEKILKDVIETAAEAVLYWLSQGTQAAMSKYNSVENRNIDNQ